MKISRKQLRKLIAEQMDPPAISSDVLTNRDLNIYQSDEKLPVDVIEMLRPHLDSGMLTGPDSSKQKGIALIDALLRTGTYKDFHGQQKVLSDSEYRALLALRKHITGKSAMDYFDRPDLDSAGSGIKMEELQNRFRRQLDDLHAALDAREMDSIPGLQQALQYTVDDIKAAGGNPGFM